MACPERVPVSFTIEVSDPDAIMALYDQIQVHRSVSGIGGPYVEITKAAPLTRLVLVTGETEYEYEDENGRETYYYRFRFYNSVSTAVSAFSDPQIGEVDPALDIISVQELKDYYLFGVDLTDDAGNPMKPGLFEHYIRSAVSSLEVKLDIPIRRTVVEAERNDFYREDYPHYIWTELSYFPVIEVDSVSIVLPGEQVIQNFAREWIHIDRVTGQMRLVPGTGTAGSILLGASGSWLPLIYGGARTIPDVFRVSYVAGFGKPTPGATDMTPGRTGPVSVPDPRLDKQFDIIKDCVGKMASFGPFNIAGDLIVGAGIASKSIGIDGLSQSISTTSSATNAGFGARLVQYQKELREVIPELKRYFKGIKLQVV